VSKYAAERTYRRGLSSADLAQVREVAASGGNDPQPDTLSPDLRHGCPFRWQRFLVWFSVHGSHV
jgi:hypothetical protein